MEKEAEQPVNIFPLEKKSSTPLTTLEGKKKKEDSSTTHSIAGWDIFLYNLRGKQNRF